MRYKFVIVSKDSNFKLPIESFTQQNVDTYFIDNNTKPITSVYNEYLRMFRIEKDADVVIFMHADVSLDINSLISHIEKCIDKYDVIGLCGCSAIKVSQSPLNWFCGSIPFPEHRWGCVTHGELGNQTSFFSQDRLNITDHEVSCIDGLCIIFGPNALKSDLSFNEKLRFNCYDTQISFECVLRKKLKLGVIVEQSLQHYSVGKSILTDDFCIDEKILREEYDLGIPENSRLAQLIKENKI